ncbi:hypothetical protein KNO81_41270 [Paraburkholderia sediminicola]|nr:hypothetical protein [Paraburkholderia sediminicola]
MRPTFRFPQLLPAIQLQDWPFYFDREQRAVLGRIREVWGEDCVIQIHGGRLRIIAERGRMEYWGGEELLSAIARLVIAGSP